MRTNSATHSRTFWACAIASANAVHLWLFFHLPSAHAVQFWITIALHTIACIGPFWMLADWFVKRRKKLRWRPWMWLFDPQTDIAFDPEKMELRDHQRYEEVVEELPKIAAEASNPDRPWWKFW